MDTAEATKTARGGRLNARAALESLGADSVIPMVLKLSFSTEATSPSLQLSGAVFTHCTVEASNDINVWTPILTGMTVAEGLWTVDVTPAGAGPWFYRARSEP